MECNLVYWKNLALNMLFAFQCLFLANITWDFFLTVVIANSHRSLIFAELSAGTAIFIILPWILGIFLLAVTLLLFIKNRDTSSVLTTRTHFDYALLMMIYAILMILGIFNPVISWPLLLNYAVNIAWALILIYFRHTIKTNL